MFTCYNTMRHNSLQCSHTWGDTSIGLPSTQIIIRESLVPSENDALLVHCVGCIYYPHRIYYLYDIANTNTLNPLRLVSELTLLFIELIMSIKNK